MRYTVKMVITFIEDKPIGVMQVDGAFKTLEELKKDLIALIEDLDRHEAILKEEENNKSSGFFGDLLRYLNIKNLNKTSVKDEAEADRLIDEWEKEHRTNEDS